MRVESIADDLRQFGGNCSSVEFHCDYPGRQHYRDNGDAKPDFVFHREPNGDILGFGSMTKEQARLFAAWILLEGQS